MNGLHDLIRTQCPDGVPFRTLGEVGRFVRGNGLQKSDLRKEGFPAIHYGQIHTQYGVHTESTYSFVSPDFANKLRRAKYGNLLIATTSEDDAALGKAVAWLGDGEVAISGDAYIYQHSLDPKFVSYFFQSDQFHDQKWRSITGTKVRRISGESLEKIRIPVPPIEVQKEIVEVLDSFSKGEIELAEMLAAELKLRHMQFALYRREVLQIGNGFFPKFKLRELVQFRNAKAHEKLVDPEGEIALMTSRFISTQGRMARYVRRADVLTPAYANEIALVMSDLPNGRALARAYYVDADDMYAANQRVGLLRVSDLSVITPRFLYYIVDRNPQLLAHDNALDQTHLKKDWILDIEIPAPPLADQHRITSSIDKMTLLHKGLAKDISAEIDGRRRQYKYYREQLFAFEMA